MSECNCRHYISRDEFDSRMDEAMRWIERLFRPGDAVTHQEFDRRMSRLENTLAGIDGHVLAVENVITEMGETMAANFDELNADLQVLVAGYQALQAENAVLKAQLATADADKQQAVADALAADDAVDQAAVDAADAVVEAALNPAPVEPPAE